MDKGFELQFNWIFVLIAGAIIMGFFFMLIKNQITISETDSARAAQQDLNFILKVSQGSSSAEKAISFNKPIEFSCADISEYRVLGSDISGRYDYHPIFAPRLLEGRELIVSTSSLKSPFRVASLAYITNKDIDHVFIGNDPIVRRLYLSMPQNASKRHIPELSAEYPNNNFDSVVFITSSDVFSLISSNSLTEFDEDVHFVVFEYDSAAQGAYGSVKFYSYSDSMRHEGSHPYLGDEMLKGAVLSHDEEMYSCNLKKITQRTNMLAKLHKKRVEALMDNPICDPYYANINAALENVRVTADAWPITNDGVRRLYEDSTDLARLNSDITQRTSCTPLY